MFFLIGDSSEEEEDENLQELIDLQASGVKVLLPQRKRARRSTEELRNSASSSTPTSARISVNPHGTATARSDGLSVVPGE
jgi:hypothetical protein